MSTSLKLLRFLKRSLLRYQVHNIIPSKFFKKTGYTAELSEWIDEHKNEHSYTSFPFNGFDTKLRYGLYDHLLKTENLNQEVDYLEFGVAAGSSFKWWMKNISNPNARFYGFDTFTGLPEDWGHFKAGDMSNGNEPPKIEDTRHTYYQGLFQATLPQFLENYTSSNRKIIHLDADLFSSTLFVLTSLSSIIKKGDIILFDEFNVPTHEFMAFKNWVDAFYIEYTVLGEVNNYYQTAIKIK